MHTYNIYMFQEHKTDMTVWLMSTITHADILFNEQWRYKNSMLTVLTPWGVCLNKFLD